MKFNITIKQQTQAINGKTKHPLYKASNQKNCDQDKGLQTLDQLLQNSSIKIFCVQCQKQITLQTLIVTYEQFNIDNDKDVANKESLLNSGRKEQEKQLSKGTKIVKIQKQKQIQSRFQKTTNTQQQQTTTRRGRPKKIQQELFEEQQDDAQEQEQLLLQSNSDSQLVYPQNNNPLIDGNNPKPQAETTKKNQTIIKNNTINRLYCVGCFATLEQFPEHYSFRKSLKFSVKNSDWNVFEQICLLNGLKIWGFGNWGQIKQFMDYNNCIFDVNQIEQHYEEIYLKQEGPQFDDAEAFDITTAHKPRHKTWEQAMHTYYFPIQSQSNLSLKRQRPGEVSVQLRRNQLTKKSSQRSSLHPSKLPKSQNDFMNELHHNSNTSLYNDQGKDKKRTKKQKLQQESDSIIQSQQSQDQQYENDNNLHQIQLKPKSSSKLPQLRRYSSGKGLKQRQSHHISNQAQGFEDEYDFTQQKNNQLQQNKIHNYTSPLLQGHNVYSYNPKRKQFQIIQYDYYAESMLAQLEFSQDDTQQQIDLKIKIIEEYNRRLDQRIKRRQFVIQHRLLDTEFMVKTIRKYNKNYAQKFQPFRRLIPKNQQYYELVDCYNQICRIKALTNGMIKVKRKLCATMKKPKFKDIIDYLNKKKEKKELLGHRMKLQNQRQRKIYYKQNGSKSSKKVILNMSQNSNSYISVQPYGNNNSNSAAGRTMTSRSQQRQRLKSQMMLQNGQNLGNMNNTNKDQDQNQNKNKQNISSQNNSSYQAYTNTRQIISSTSLMNIMSFEEIQGIQKQIRKSLQSNQNKQISSLEFLQNSLMFKNIEVKKLSSFL